MTQTLALLVDAYRDLNSKKLFWMTIHFSWLVVLIFLAIGINDKGMTIFGWHLPMKADYNTHVVTPATFYREAYYRIGVNVWLAAIATIIALASTSGIFPDLLTGGSVELYISTPISRLRLFLTKYLSGLLFVAMQVGVFTVASFIVMRFRVGEWMPKLFLAIPLVVLVYSYVHCVCVLLGVWSKSATTALILGIVFWLTIFAVQFLETEKYLSAMQKQQIVIKRLDREIKLGRPTAIVDKDKKVADMQAEKMENQQELAYQTKFHDAIYMIECVLPKANDTMALLRGNLITSEEDKRAEGRLGDAESMADPVAINSAGSTSEDLRARSQMLRIVRSRSIAWSIGSSLIFEAVVVSIAACLFCRRDY